MMRKAKVVVALILISLVGAWFLFLSYQKDEPKQLNIEVPAEMTSELEPEQKQEIVDTEQPSLTPEELLEAAPKISELLEITNAANREIYFYGRVVDQNGEPVPNATVNYQIPTYKGGISPVVRNLSKPTGADGSFILEGESGTTLIMRSIEKPGYTFEKMWGKNYFFLPRTVGETAYKSDPAKPVLFKAWRKTETARELRRGEDYWTVPSNGRAYKLPIPGLDNDVKIAFSRKDADEKQWEVRLTVENGGLIPSNEPFMYEAPEAGYEPIWTATSSDFDSRQNFFLQAKGGQVYGVLEMRFAGYYSDSEDYVKYAYRLNPTGSRNLLSEQD